MGLRTSTDIIFPSTVESGNVLYVVEPLVLINNATTPHLSGPLKSRRHCTVCHSAPTGLLFTFCEGRGLGRVCQAELALLPAAVVADQRVVGLLDVHVVADAEHVTGGLDVSTTQPKGRTRTLLKTSLHTYRGARITKDSEAALLQANWGCHHCCISRLSVDEQKHATSSVVVVVNH